MKIMTTLIPLRPGQASPSPHRAYPLIFRKRLSGWQLFQQHLYGNLVLSHVPRSSIFDQEWWYDAATDKLGTKWDIITVN
jgi:hypothetical protein